MKKILEHFCRLVISFGLWLCSIWLFELEGFIVITSFGLCLFLVFSDLIIISLMNGIDQFMKSEEEFFRK